jgi:uncharacterized protein (DUF885 family)
VTLRPILLALAVSAALAAATARPRPTPPHRHAQATTVDAKAKAEQLNKLYAEYWEENLKLNPVLATFQGDPRYNAELPDFGSAQYRDESKRFTSDWLKKIEAIGPQGLDGQDLLSYEIFVDDAKEALESYSTRPGSCR